MSEVFKPEHFPVPLHTVSVFQDRAGREIIEDRPIAERELAVIVRFSLKRGRKAEDNTWFLEAFTDTDPGLKLLRRDAFRRRSRRAFNDAKSLCIRASNFEATAVIAEGEFELRDMYVGQPTVMVTEDWNKGYKAVNGRNGLSGLQGNFGELLVRALNTPSHLSREVMTLGVPKDAVDFRHQSTTLMPIGGISENRVRGLERSLGLRRGALTINPFTNGVTGNEPGKPGLFVHSELIPGGWLMVDASDCETWGDAWKKLINEMEIVLKRK